MRDLDKNQTSSVCKLSWMRGDSETVKMAQNSASSDLEENREERTSP